MVEYKSKWNKYEIGKTSWINERRTHPARTAFIETTERIVPRWCSKMSIIEIGAGECTEAIQLKGITDYTVMDVSDVFLKHATDNGIKTIKCDMVSLPPNFEKKYDTLYMCAVLEHTPNLIKTIRVIKSIAHRFIITMFRWGYNGNITPQYKSNRKYYSSVFDIDRIFKMLGNIDIAVLITEDDRSIDYKQYEKTVDKTKEHRTGDWLTIIGHN